MSATAWHWADPGVGWARAAGLLRPGGWLALLTTAEHYQEPFLTQLRQLWMRYSRQGAWADRPDQAGFTAGLRSLLEPGSGVDLAQETLFAMAQAAS